MSSTSYVVVISITIAAGVIIWLSLTSTKDNVQEWSNKTNETLITPKPTTEAWITYNGILNGTMMVFNPANKSLSPRKSSAFEKAKDVDIEISAQNDKLGVFFGYEESTYDYKIFTFDKQQQNITKKYVYVDSYSKQDLGVSGVNAFIFSPPDGDCLTVCLLSTLDNQEIDYDMETNVCRQRPYCVASMNTGDVYILGGVSSSNEGMLNSEKYSAELGSFVDIADFPIYLDSADYESSYCIATEYKENVFVCDNNESNNQSCYIYHTDSNNWETVGGFQTDRDHYKLVVVGEDLFAIGGTQMKSIERFVPERKTWEVFMNDVEEINIDDDKSYIAFSVEK